MAEQTLSLPAASLSIKNKNQQWIVK